MPRTIEEIRARQDEIADRINELHREFQGDLMPDEAREEWHTLVEERRTNETVLEELEVREQYVESLSGIPANTETGAHFNTNRSRARGEDIYDLTTVRMSAASPTEAAMELRDRAKRSLEAAQFAHRDADRSATQEHIERLLDGADSRDGVLARHMLLTGSQTYKRAFAKHLAGSPLTTEESRALSLTASEGGYAVPYTLDPTIIPTSNGAVNPLRAISRVETITTNEWKGVSSAGVRATRVAEATEATDDSPRLAQPEVKAERVQTFVPFSLEIGADWGGLLPSLAVALQDAKDEEESTSFMTGDGVAPRAEGLLTGATRTVKTTTRSTFAVADIYKLQESLPERFDPRARFVGHKAIYNRVRQFDTNGGASLWVRLTDGNPPELVGYPAHSASAMASAVADRALILVFGDFRYFLIVDRVGMTVRVIPDLFGPNGRPTGQSGLFAYWRNNSTVLDANAFRVLQVDPAS